MPALVASHLSELDSLLAELNNAKFTEQFNKKDKGRYTEQETTCRSQHFNNGIKCQTTNRPLPTRFKDAFAPFSALSVDSPLNGNRREHSGLTKILTREHRVQNDVLTVNTREQGVQENVLTGNRREHEVQDNVLTVNRREQEVQDNVLTVNRREQDMKDNVLTVNGREQNTLATENRKEDSSLAFVLKDFDMAEREPTGGRDDYADYDYSYLGKGIWGNQDYGSTSNYSTLHTSQDEYDYSTLDRDNLPLSEDELEKSTGAGPRGDRSKVIETDHGEVQSKYRYMGFGLWENTDPNKPKKRKKLRPPPPPPKAQPIIYNCTVSVTKSTSSKELDDLKMKDIGRGLVKRVIEPAIGIGCLQVRDPFEMFEKEDTSDMFKRAMMEKMELVDNPRAKYRCFVCSNMIQGRIITAMGNKFHPHCFVCTYCRKEFKDRKYKTDPRDYKPYCFSCFEKLLGHYGSAHQG